MRGDTVSDSLSRIGETETSRGRQKVLQLEMCPTNEAYKPYYLSAIRNALLDSESQQWLYRKVLFFSF